MLKMVTNTLAFRCFLFGRAIVVLSECSFKHVRPKKKLERMRISKLNGTLIFGKMDDDMTSSSLCQTILELFPRGLPWEDIVKKASSRPLIDDDMRDDTTMINEDHGEDEDDENAAFFGKGKGKGKKQDQVHPLPQSKARGFEVLAAMGEMPTEPREETNVRDGFRQCGHWC